MCADDLADVLRAARAKSGLSYAGLGEKLGINRVTAFNREQGKHDMPASQLRDFARATGCTIVVGPDGWEVLDAAPAALQANPERDNPLDAEAERPYHLPLLGVASAGPGTWNDDQPAETVSIAGGWLNRLDGVVRVHGDSMEPLLTDGDLVGVRLGETFKIGDVVIAVASYGECLLKVYAGHLEDQNMVMLTSLNQAYGAVAGSPEDLIIQGVAYGMLRMERLRA